MSANSLEGAGPIFAGAHLAPSPDVDAAQLPGATRRPHVCFVAPNIWPVLSGDPDIAVAGGAEVQQSILARLLVQNGYRVSVICSDWGQPQRAVRDGITVFKTYRQQAGIPVLRFVHPRLTGIWRALHEVDADIYYQRAADMVTAVVATFCRRRRKHSIFAAASNTDFIPGKQLIQYRRDRWLFERGLAAVDAVVVQNQTQKRLCAEHYGRDATLIPSCYQLPDSARSGPSEYVLWVAAIRQTKRPELLFEMARRLPHRRFVMIGGPADTKLADLAYYADIRRAAAQLPNVEFAGFLPLQQADQHFDRARVVVNTSDVNREGMPNVFLQAWARGVPTVAFNDTDARLDGDIVYPVVDDIAAATAAIERMFADDVYRARFSNRCLAYFTRTHGTAAVLAHYQRFFKALERGSER